MEIYIVPARQDTVAAYKKPAPSWLEQSKGWAYRLVMAFFRGPKAWNCFGMGSR